MRPSVTFKNDPFGRRTAPSRNSGWQDQASGLWRHMRREPKTPIGQFDPHDTLEGIVGPALGGTFEGLKRGLAFERPTIYFHAFRRALLRVDFKHYGSCRWQVTSFPSGNLDGNSTRGPRNLEVLAQVEPLFVPEADAVIFIVIA